MTHSRSSALLLHCSPTLAHACGAPQSIPSTPPLPLPCRPFIYFYGSNSLACGITSCYVSCVAYPIPAPLPPPSPAPPQFIYFYGSNGLACDTTSSKVVATGVFAKFSPFLSLTCKDLGEQ